MSTVPHDDGTRAPKVAEPLDLDALEHLETHPQVYDGLRSRHTRKVIHEMSEHVTNMCRACGETFPCSTVQLLAERDGFLAAARERDELRKQYPPAPHKEHCAATWGARCDCAFDFDAKLRAKLRAARNELQAARTLLARIHADFGIETDADAYETVGRTNAFACDARDRLAVLTRERDALREALGEMMVVYAGIGHGAGWEIAPANRAALMAAAEQDAPPSGSCVKPMRPEGGTTMTMLEQIREHDRSLGPTAELGGVYRHRRWLLARVEELAAALRECRQSLFYADGDHTCLSQVDAALVALEAPADE